MSSALSRIIYGIMFLLGVCFCVFYYPTYAHSPSSMTETDNGTSINRQTYNTSGETKPVLKQETNVPNKPQGQSGDKKDTPGEFSPAGTGPNAVTTETEQPIKIPPGNTENIAEPDTGITPEPSTTPLQTAANTDSQLIKRVDGIDDMVAITFDDGPYPQMTEQYLAVLDELNARATFFMVGRRIAYYPDLARQVVEQGSEIGSHSWQHARLDQLTAEAIVEDMQLVKNQVQAATGRAVNLLRPPYGGRNEVLLAVAEEQGYKLIIWDVDPRDWEDPTPEKIVDSVVGQAKPGSIIVMHEGHENTLQALPEIIQKLRERGLEPVTVSEMLNRALAQPQSNSAVEGNQAKQ